jgi:hypothetical protein
MKIPFVESSRDGKIIKFDLKGIYVRMLTGFILLSTAHANTVMCIWIS